MPRWLWKLLIGAGISIAVLLAAQRDPPREAPDAWYPRGRMDLKQELVAMARLGTRKRPAVVRVRNADRAQEILELCTRKGWEVILGLEPDLAEDLTDVQKLMGPVSAWQAAARISRNGPCPCGSRRKFKNCCAKG